jgi:hypothetical protein
VTPRSFLISRIVLCVAYVGLGVWGLADGKYLFSGFYLAFSVAWLLMALSGNNFAAERERQRARVRGHGAISFPPASSSREDE